MTDYPLTGTRRFDIHVSSDLWHALNHIKQALEVQTIDETAGTILWTAIGQYYPEAIEAVRDYNVAMTLQETRAEETRKKIKARVQSEQKGKVQP